MERFSVPIKPERYYANTIHDRIETHIKDCLDDLKDTEDLLVEVPLQSGLIITASYFGYRNPNFIVVNGTDKNSNFMSALVPQDSIEVVVKTIEKHSTERREIGFQSKDIE